MAKITKTLEVTICDKCGKDAWKHCSNCPKEFCSTCGDIELKEYRAHKHYYNGDDSKYCLDCETKLLQTQDPLYMAYREFEQMINHEKIWYEDWNKKTKAQEDLIVRLKGRKID